MAIERASVQVAHKPWGVENLRPWSSIDGSDELIGELRFGRADESETACHLLLKILFAHQSLSIQVHPSDACARLLGLPNGKTEAWYILSAAPKAQVALGLKRDLNPTQLRQAIGDGSIAELVRWIPVKAGECIFVPAGTIHAIGGGIVLAEVQQFSDATFRLFDFGRQRPLNEDDAVAASDAGPFKARASSRRLTTERTAQITDAHFVVELIALPARSHWSLTADRETWLLVTEGDAKIGEIRASIGDVIFADADHAEIEVGSEGMSGLVAYPGPDPAMGLLEPCLAGAKQSGEPPSRGFTVKAIVEVRS